MYFSELLVIVKNAIRPLHYLCDTLNLNLISFYLVFLYYHYYYFCFLFTDNDRICILFP